MNVYIMIIHVYLSDDEHEESEQEDDFNTEGILDNVKFPEFKVSLFNTLTIHRLAVGVNQRT